MATPTRDPLTTTIKIIVNWIALGVPENGYSTVESYNLQWDRGTKGVTWYNLIGFDADVLATRYDTVHTLTAGTTYKFKVRAKNFFGWSEFSPILDIKAATWPENTQSVTTTIDGSTGGVLVSWLAPYNNAQVLQRYEILLYS